jgi:hypothetical protein
MNKEEIYNRDIAPLMAQIIGVCEANKIAVLATFHIPTEEDENLQCTTALLTDEFNPPERLVKALGVIRPPALPSLMVTTQSPRTPATPEEQSAYNSGKAAFNPRDRLLEVMAINPYAGDSSNPLSRWWLMGWNAACVDHGGG